MAMVKNYGDGDLTIPDLRIFANTMLGYPVVGCSNLSLSSGNLDNSSNNITMPSDGAIYRYDGTISVHRTGQAMQTCITTILRT